MGRETEVGVFYRSVAGESLVHGLFALTVALQANGAVGKLTHLTETGKNREKRGGLLRQQSLK